MNKAWYLLIAFTLTVLACSGLTQPFSPTATVAPTLSAAGLNPECPDPQPTQKDIDFALQYNDEYFPAPGWKNSYTVMEYRVSVTWKNDELSSVANIDHLIFCNVTSAALDAYYSPATFDLIFQNYETHEPQDDCRSDHLRLYDFKVSDQGYDYNARFWVELIDGDHTRETLLVFPVADLENLNSYSKKLMPDLPSCP